LTLTCHSDRPLRRPPNQERMTSKTSDRHAGSIISNRKVIVYQSSICEYPGDGVCANRKIHMCGEQPRRPQGMALLGESGLTTSAIGLGSAPFACLYGDVGRRDCVRAIDVALENGMTLVDTADFYANGEIERLIGRSVASRRDRVVIATHGGARAVQHGLPTAIDGSPAYLATACDASLRRLLTDYIDLYFLSRVDPRVPVEESMGKLAELVAAGKIRHVGLCEPSADDLRRAHAVHPVSAIAVEYSLRDRSAERSVLATAEELDVGVVAYCPLARGRLLDPGPEASAEDRRGLREVQAEAAELDVGVARLALVWLLRCRGAVPVPGSCSPAHLEMNASAAGIALSPEVCARLAAAFSP
jgi:aryl-alcohol dehydrogenase-like predicted oxidoreductase